MLFLLAERARSECTRSMRAIKGSLGQLSLKYIRNQIGLIGRAQVESGTTSAHCFRGEGRKDRSIGVRTTDPSRRGRSPEGNTNASSNT
jgi:hypothetical protein